MRNWKDPDTIGMAVSGRMTDGRIGGAYGRDCEKMEWCWICLCHIIDWRTPKEANSSFILDGSPQWFISTHASESGQVSLWGRQRGEETLFLLCFSWKKVQKYTEKTTKLYRLLEPKMYLLTKLLKIPYLNKNQDCFSRGGFAREKTTGLSANRTWLAWMVDAMQQSWGWIWANNVMLTQIMNPLGYIFCPNQQGKNPGSIS